MFAKNINSSVFLVLVGDSGIICFNLDFILESCIFYENGVFFFSTVTDSSGQFSGTFPFSFSCFLLSQSVLLSHTVLFKLLLKIVYFSQVSTLPLLH